MKQRAPMAIMEWRVCVGFPAYEVSEYGHIRRRQAGRTRFVTGDLLNPGAAYGYFHFALYRDGERKTIKSSIIVALTFIGPKPFDKAQVCHNDGVRSNDHYTNLRWGTQTENWADRYIHGTSVEGAKNPRAKLSLEDVARIKELSASGHTNASLAMQFAVGKSAIKDILSGKSWKCAAA